MYTLTVMDGDGKTVFSTTLSEREFTTGSCGYTAQGRVTLPSIRDRVQRDHVVNVNLTEAKSKERK